MQTHDIGRTFWHTLTLQKSSPVYHVAGTVEVEDPYRVCERTHILRVPFTGLGVAFGLWEKLAIDDEDVALLRALQGTLTVSPLDETGHIIPEYENRLFGG